MQFRQFFLFLSFLFCLLGATEAIAQKIRTNEAGEKIIVYPDGSWKYFNDQSVEEPVEEVQEVLSEEELAAQKKAEKEKRKAERKKAKAEKRLEGRNEDLVNQKKKKSRDRSKANNKNALDIVQTVDPAEEKEARLEALKSAETAAAEEAEAQSEWEEAFIQLATVQNDEAIYKQNAATTQEELDEIAAELKVAKAAEKEAKAKLKKAQKKAKQMSKLVDMPMGKRNKMLAKMEEEQTLKANRPLKRQKGNEVFSDHAFDNSAPYVAPKKTFASYKKENDVIYNPPKSPCTLTFNGIDEFSGKKRKDVKKQKLFSYTSDQLAPYFKDRDYITSHGYVSSISGGFKLIYLHFDIVSENAQREFGSLPKGSILSIKFIDGTTVKLANQKTDRGILNSVEKVVSYRAQYIVDSATEKALRKKEVDKVRVVWGTGYEDYDVYELDFFVNQFNCLDQN